MITNNAPRNAPSSASENSALSEVMRSTKVSQFQPRISVLVRPDKSLLRLDHLDMSWSVERSRQRLACAARTTDRAKPIFEAWRRDEPKEAHLLRTRIRDLVLQTPADQNHSFRENVIKFALNVGFAGAAIAEQ